VLERVGQLALDGGDRLPGDFGIGALLRARQANLDVVGQSDDAGHPLGAAFRFVLFAEAADEAGEGHHAILDRDAQCRQT
jgi:hypothetical protein